MDIELWYGIFGPAELPAEVVTKWSAALAAALELDDAKDVLLKQGLPPTLGQGQVALTMLVFSVGAALPLLLLGIASRETMVLLRGRLMTTNCGAKLALGAILIALGLLILSGFDKKVEAVAVDLSPVWLTSLTTRF